MKHLILIKMLWTFYYLCLQNIRNLILLIFLCFLSLIFSLPTDLKSSSYRVHQIKFQFLMVLCYWKCPEHRCRPLRSNSRRNSCLSCRLWPGLIISFLLHTQIISLCFPRTFPYTGKDYKICHCCRGCLWGKKYVLCLQISRNLIFLS
jgi:hypothetical protein